MNRDFVGTAAENSWLIDEKLSVETVSNTSDGTLFLSLVHCSDLPFGLIFCNMSIIETIDIFKKPCLRHELQVYHGSLKWKILYHEKHLRQFHDKISKVYQLRCENNTKETVDKAETPPLPIYQKDPGTKTYQTYMNRLLKHPWASGSVELLEFIGVMNSSRANDDGKQVVHISQASKFLSVGDVIFFKCSDVSGNLTRMAMNSEYDHVGIVVKDSQLGGLKLLEASSAEGVNTYPLVGRLRGYYLAGYVDKIGIRKLRNFVAEQNKILDGISFLKTVKGNKYSFSILEYVRNLSNGFNTRDDKDYSKAGSNKDEAGMQLYNENSKYFCSEIVVTYLSLIGAIDTKGLKHSAFLPSHFLPGNRIENFLCCDRNGDGSQMYFDDLVLLDCRILELSKAEECTTNHYRALD